MENIDNLHNYEHITSEETYEPVIELLEQTFYPAPAYWMEVLGIFPTEFRGATYYQPLFYYVPVYDNFNYSLSPDLVQEVYETECTECCSSDSDTEFSSSSSDTYYTADESEESLFDPDECNCKAEEFGYLSETGLEKTSVDYSTNDRFESSKDKECLPSEILKNDYEKKDNDATLPKNVQEIKSDYSPTYESNTDNGHCGSENASNICDETYKDILSQTDNCYETKESQFLGIDNTESYGEIECFPSVNSARSCDENGSGDVPLPKISTFENSIKDSFADNIKNGKVNKPRPFSNRGNSERGDFAQKYSMNIFESGDVNNKDRHNQGLKKCNTFENLSNAKPKQYVKKIDSLENLSRFDENEIYEKDLPCENSEIETNDYECDMKNLPFDPDEFDFTKEEVKYFKDNIYRRALSGKLYQKRYIPSVAVLPTIYEEDESFRETDEQRADSHTSCLTEQQGHFDCSLCNLFDPSEENGEAEQKPKKKRIKRIREILTKMFCCVKPP